jgi:phosphoribosylaminoimidazole carboxylase (NCAIR synthetase)
MYRKAESRPNRKLGHATIIANSLDELLEKAQILQHNLTIVAN